jgi:type III pantothenate kinase
MILVLDVGNTNITIGVYPLDRPSPGPAPDHFWRLPTRRDATGDELGIQLLSLFQSSRLPVARIKAAAAASVVPSLDAPLSEAVFRYAGVRPLLVGPGVRTGVRNLYKPPSDVGADRLVNAAAAFARVKGACVIVDFGTATTVDAVDRRGAYLGGAIVPGPRMAAEALARGTAKLPLLEEIAHPPRVLGRTTRDSLASGLYYGYAGLVGELVRRMKSELGGSPTVLATGGLAEIWAPVVPGVKGVLPYLTLEGLWLIWNRNR